MNKRDIKPGLYLDISNDDYHKGPGISKTTLDNFSTDPESVIWEKNCPQDKEKLTTLDFGEIRSGQEHSRQLILHNHLNEDIRIKKVAFAKKIFSCNLDTIQIPANAMKVFNIYIEALHNLDYTDFLTIETTKSLKPLIAEIKAKIVYDGSYYTSTHNKWGNDLKSALHNIIKDHIAHIHLKDGIIDLPRYSFCFCAPGEGQVREYKRILKTLKSDGYDGVLSLEPEFIPRGGTKEDAARICHSKVLGLMG